MLGGGEARDKGRFASSLVEELRDGGVRSQANEGGEARSRLLIGRIQS